MAWPRPHVLDRRACLATYGRAWLDVTTLAWPPASVLAWTPLRVVAAVTFLDAAACS
jgi:hypothetical protein